MDWIASIASWLRSVASELSWLSPLKSWFDEAPNWVLFSFAMTPLAAVSARVVQLLLQQRHRATFETVPVRGQSRIPSGDFAFSMSASAEAKRAAREVLERTEGLLIYDVPERMQHKETHIAEVRIGTEKMQGIFSEFQNTGEPKKEKISVVETMSVSLRGEAKCFEISSVSPAAQIIVVDPTRPTAFDGNEFGRWLFEVTPQKWGKRKLYVCVSARVDGGLGRASQSLPDREFEVKVDVPLSGVALFVLRKTWALAALIFASIVGAATQAYWWPFVDRILQSLNKALVG